MADERKTQRVRKRRKKIMKRRTGETNKKRGKDSTESGSQTDREIGWGKRRLYSDRKRER